MYVRLSIKIWLWVAIQVFFSMLIQSTIIDEINPALKASYSDESDLSLITTICYNVLEGKEGWCMKGPIEA